MECPLCQSRQTKKNGRRGERQCYKCKQCGRQFLESYRSWQYSNEVRQLCVRMHLKGMGLREIERATNIHHTTIRHWILGGEPEQGDRLRRERSPLDLTTCLSLKVYSLQSI